jgi:hypothetical protein
MPPAVRLGILLGAIAVLLVLGVYVSLWLRKTLVGEPEDEDYEDPGYTTAELERLKAEGLLDDEQYGKLKALSLDAAKRRAEAARHRRTDKPRGLFR